VAAPGGSGFLDVVVLPLNYASVVMIDERRAGVGVQKRQKKIWTRYDSNADLPHSALAMCNATLSSPGLAVQGGAGF
jgi:hypothetical protein